MLHLANAGNEKEFMPEFKCLCAERELLMSKIKWIVLIITQKKLFTPSFVSLLPRSVIGVDSTAHQTRKEKNCEQDPEGKNAGVT